MADTTDVVRIRESGPPTVQPTHPIPPDPPTTARIAVDGVSIPGYEILSELGRGGMGVVYKARQLSLNRLVALKVMIGGAHAGAVEKARFKIEAEAVARVHHPNIVQVYDVGEWNGIEFIAFEYVDGPTVRQWQNSNPIEPHVAARIAIAVARAVQHAHDRGIIHRDLKPANVILAGAGDRDSAADDGNSLTVPDCRSPVRVPKVMDFGLAKILEGGADLTVSGVACGTPNYMAPEQVRGGPATARPAVDVWGIGAVLFEMLAGRPAFAGSDAASIMQGILLRELPSVRKLVPTIPRDLAVIVAKCLEKEPTRRYLSPADVADDLERFLTGRPILARPVGTAVCVRRWVRRNPMASAFCTFLFLSLCGVSTFAWALSQSVTREREATDRERSALLNEAIHRTEAEQATRAVSAARDDLRGALNKSERSLALARVESSRAENERDRAQKNLTFARKAVTNVLVTLGSHDVDTYSALVPVYRHLLSDFEPFVAEMIARNTSDVGLRLDEVRIMRGRGILEATSGRHLAARECLLDACGRLRKLVKDDPRNVIYCRELGCTLARAGSVSIELHIPDALSLLREAQTILERSLKDHPKDVFSLHALISARLVMNGAAGTGFTDEHNLAVLDLVERVVAIEGPTRNSTMIRAHALNNIASDLTNRDKTDDAESIWLEALAIREDLARTDSQDRIARYELAKCLTNYANQLARTDRLLPALQHRERAAQLFDTLRDDARFRATYVPLMVDTNIILASEYRKQSQTEKALDHLNSAIALNAIMLAHTPLVPRIRAIHADAHTRRAEENERMRKYAKAAQDYKVASEFSTTQPHREYCSTRHVQALAHSGDRLGALNAASKLNPDKFCHPIPCVELARGWLMIAKLIGDEAGLPEGERAKISAATLRGAHNAILAAQKLGLFGTPQAIRAFQADKEWEPIRDVFP